MSTLHELLAWGLGSLATLGPLSILASVLAHRIEEEGASDGEERGPGRDAPSLVPPHKSFRDRYQTLMNTVQDTVAIIRSDGTILEISRSVEESIGFKPEEMVGRDPFELCHPEDVGKAQSTLEEIARSPGVTRMVDMRMRAKDGKYRTFEVVGCRAEDGGEVVIVSRDVTERRELEEKLNRRAHYDSLTELPNRRHFLDELERFLEAGSRESRRAAVLFVDLDGFKKINDDLGHAAGDELLRLVARRLRQSTREQDLVARLGGDEFAVLLRGVDEGFCPQTAARRLIRSLDRPFEIRGETVRVGASVGIADGRAGEVGARQLLSSADLAMYRAKGLKGKHVASYASHRDHGARERSAEVREELHEALRKRNLDLGLQPVYDLGSGDLVGGEAFPVWRCSDGDAYEDAELLGLAERSDLVPELAASLVSRLKELSRSSEGCWREIGGRPTSFFSFNLPGRHLRDPRVRSALRRELEDGRSGPGELVLEIEETEIGDRVSLAEAAEGLGLTLAIDRFGTGCSCLSLLRKLPVDYLKVDRSLVEDLHAGGDGEKILESVVDMARRLGVRVVAMAVEDRELARRLAALGCDLAQGPAFGGLLTPDTFLDRVVPGSQASSWVA